MERRPALKTGSPEMEWGSGPQSSAKQCGVWHDARDVDLLNVVRIHYPAPNLQWRSPIMVLERFAKPSVDESRLQGSSPCSSANTDEEQQLIDEIVEMTSDLYDLEYAK